MLQFSLKGRELITKVSNYDNIINIVKDDVRSALSNREELKKEQYPAEPLTTILAVIISRSYWRKQRFKEVIRRLEKKDFKTIDHDWAKIRYEDLELVINIIEEIYKETKQVLWKRTYQSLKVFRNAIEKAGSLREWVNTLYDIIKKGGNWRNHEYFRGIEGVGFKGINLMLRDLGYFDMIPIDRHERRFLIRTGIVLHYGPPSGDPKYDDFYIKALKKFCEIHLKDFEIEGIPLNKAPGVVDLIIWYFSCERKPENCKGICSSNPKCWICPIKDLCLYGIIHSSNSKTT